MILRKKKCEFSQDRSPDSQTCLTPGKAQIQNERAAELGRIGGRKNRHYPDSTDPIQTNPPKSADDVRSLLAETMASVHARRLDHKVGIVLASLGKALLEAIEIADLEGRVKALEKRIANTER